MGTKEEDGVSEWKRRLEIGSRRRMLMMAIARTQDAEKSQLFKILQQNCGDDFVPTPRNTINSSCHVETQDLVSPPATATARDTTSGHISNETKDRTQGSTRRPEEDPSDSPTVLRLVKSYSLASAPVTVLEGQNERVRSMKKDSPTGKSISVTQHRGAEPVRRVVSHPSEKEKEWLKESWLPKLETGVELGAKRIQLGRSESDEDRRCLKPSKYLPSLAHADQAESSEPIDYRWREKIGHRESLAIMMTPGLRGVRTFDDGPLLQGPSTIRAEEDLKKCPSDEPQSALRNAPSIVHRSSLEPEHYYSHSRTQPRSTHPSIPHLVDSDDQVESISEEFCHFAFDKPLWSPTLKSMLRREGTSPSNDRQSAALRKARLQRTTNPRFSGKTVRADPSRKNRRFFLETRLQTTKTDRMTLILGTPTRRMSLRKPFFSDQPKNEAEEIYRPQTPLTPQSNSCRQGTDSCSTHSPIGAYHGVVKSFFQNLLIEEDDEIPSDEEPTFDDDDTHPSIEEIGQWCPTSLPPSSSSRTQIHSESPTCKQKAEGLLAHLPSTHADISPSPPPDCRRRSSQGVPPCSTRVTREGSEYEGIECGDRYIPSVVLSCIQNQSTSCSPSQALKGKDLPSHQEHPSNDGGTKEPRNRETKVFPTALEFVGLKDVENSSRKIFVSSVEDTSGRSRGTNGARASPTPVCRTPKPETNAPSMIPQKVWRFYEPEDATSLALLVSFTERDDNFSQSDRVVNSTAINPLPEPPNRCREVFLNRPSGLSVDSKVTESTKLFQQLMPTPTADQKAGSPDKQVKSENSHDIDFCGQLLEGYHAFRGTSPSLKENKANHVVPAGGCQSSLPSSKSMELAGKLKSMVEEKPAWKKALQEANLLQADLEKSIDCEHRRTSDKVRKSSQLTVEVDIGAPKSRTSENEKSGQQSEGISTSAESGDVNLDRRFDPLSRSGSEPEGKKKDCDSVAANTLPPADESDDVRTVPSTGADSIAASFEELISELQTFVNKEGLQKERRDDPESSMSSTCSRGEENEMLVDFTPEQVIQRLSSKVNASNRNASEATPLVSNNLKHFSFGEFASSRTEVSRSDEVEKIARAIDQIAAVLEKTKRTLPLENRDSFVLHAPRKSVANRGNKFEAVPREAVASTKQESTGGDDHDEDDTYLTSFDQSSSENSSYEGTYLLQMKSTKISSTISSSATSKPLSKSFNFTVLSSLSDSDDDETASSSPSDDDSTAPDEYSRADTGDGNEDDDASSVSSSKSFSVPREIFPHLESNAVTQPCSPGSDSVLHPIMREEIETELVLRHERASLRGDASFIAGDRGVDVLSYAGDAYQHQQDVSKAGGISTSGNLDAPVARHKSSESKHGNKRSTSRRRRRSDSSSIFSTNSIIADRSFSESDNENKNRGNRKQTHHNNRNGASPTSPAKNGGRSNRKARAEMRSQKQQQGQRQKESQYALIRSPQHMGGSEGVCPEGFREVFFNPTLLCRCTGPASTCSPRAGSFDETTIGRERLIADSDGALRCI